MLICTDNGITTGLSGSVSPIYAASNLLGQAGVVFGHDLTSEAALTKLSYLLALPDLSPQEVARQMSVSIRGELTEHVKTSFQHPNGTLSPRVANLAALGYAITRGDIEAVRELMKGEPGVLLNEADYSGNTPLVSQLSRRTTIAVPSSRGHHAVDLGQSPSLNDRTNRFRNESPYLPPPSTNQHPRQAHHLAVSL